MKRFKSIKSFTLAETMIIIVILGIIAVLTVPSLIRKEQEKQTVVKVKKIYADLQNAFDIAEKYAGPINEWVDLKNDWSSTSSGNRNTKYAKYLLSENFKIQKSCGVSETGCGVVTGTCKYLNGTDISGSNNYYNFCDSSTGIWTFAGKWNRTLLNNGTTIAIKAPRSSSILNIEIVIAVDLNGEKGPNTFGKDIFFFRMYEKGIEPYSGFDAVNDCMLTKAGTSCAKYIIINGNMNYPKN